MSDEEIIIEVAKLDDYMMTHWKCNPFDAIFKDEGHYQYYLKQLPQYLTSYDAIIPVIEKVLGVNEELWSKFLHELGQLVGFHKGMEVGRWHLMKRFMLATPQQLCIALLKSASLQRG